MTRTETRVRQLWGDMAQFEPERSYVVLPLCSGRHEIEVSQPDYVTKTFTYTSPRDRSEGTNSFTDEVDVELTRR